MQKNPEIKKADRTAADARYVTYAKQIAGMIAASTKKETK